MKRGNHCPKRPLGRVVIEIPGELRVPPSEVEERVGAELALRLYVKGIASFAQARKIASLTKWGFLELLAKEGIPLHYGEEELEEDLMAAKGLASRGLVLK